MEDEMTGTEKWEEEFVNREINYPYLDFTGSTPTCRGCAAPAGTDGVLTHSGLCPVAAALASSEELPAYW